MSMTCTACESAATTTCTLCHAGLCNEHIQKGQPFITARQLVATTATTAFRTPQLLGDILFRELDAVKRQAEQTKFLLSVLLLMLLAASVPLYLLLAA
jgi:hypothetical protein